MSRLVEKDADNTKDVKDIKAFPATIHSGTAVQISNASAHIPAYFPPHHSISRYAGTQIEQVLTAVAGRFVGAHPAHPPVYRVHSERGFRRLPDCRYDMNLHERFPSVQSGEFVYVWGKLWSDTEAELPFAISCYSPARVYINGRSVFRSNLNEDVFPERRSYFRAKLDAGWNHIVLEFVAVGTGCGGIFGTGSVKGAPLHFLMPTAEHNGCEGWLYSAPQQQRWSVWPGQSNVESSGADMHHRQEKTATSHTITDGRDNVREERSSVTLGYGEADLAARYTWYPELRWTEQEQQEGQLSRIFGVKQDAVAFSWCSIESMNPEPILVKLHGSCRAISSLAVYLDGTLISNKAQDRDHLIVPLRLDFGRHELIVESVCDGEGWGFELELDPDRDRDRDRDRDSDLDAAFANNASLVSLDGAVTTADSGGAEKGRQTTGAGVDINVDMDVPTSKAMAESIRPANTQADRENSTNNNAAIQKVRLVQPYPIEGSTDPWLHLGPFEVESAPSVASLSTVRALLGEGATAQFWRVDQPDSWVRPYTETAMYGRWNYPLGVTLYGLLATGQELSQPYFAEYAQGHIEQCTTLHTYALWDRDRFGAPGINHQLTLIDSLDDCGSFGAAMLVAHRMRPLQGAEKAAADIAAYISETQDRQEDGALYRAAGTTDFMKDTMWCDDLYMSTPFLTEYYRLTGEAAYLEDAARQFLLYRKRMFQPELGIMHHVYDIKFDKPNGVPWGRGNGWVIFSLTELLTVMPEEYELREKLLHFWNELAYGYLRLQDQQGLWHQVLTDPESYAEASCTSMFIYAYARGVRLGWVSEPDVFISSAQRGWEGLSRYCIDKNGNVYGVCRGSGYSFNKLYYKEELDWQLNDTHGIGIVLLAGVELLRLTRSCSG